LHSFIDREIESDVNNYRIKWVVESNTWKYSNIVTIKNELNAAGLYSVAPNPANNNFTLRLKEKPSKTIQWLLADATGRIVKVGSINNTQEQITVSELTPGQYFLKLSIGKVFPVLILR